MTAPFSPLARKVLERVKFIGYPPELHSIIRELLELVERQREALDRQAHPHIESFCKQRANDALTHTDEVMRKLGE